MPIHGGATAPPQESGTWGGESTISSSPSACAAASPAYEALGLPGFVCPDRFAEIGEAFFEGNIGYHLRAGGHYLSREDWNLFIRFANSKN